MADVARGSLKHRQHVERLHVAVEPGHLGGRQVEVVHAELAGLGEERVVDVGDVAHALACRGRGRAGGAAARRRRRRRSAWPRWVASYGVMPHVYIVTTGPGSNGTTSWRAVSYRRIGIARRSGLDAGELRRHPGLVADVELQQHGGEGLDRRGVRQLAGVERPAAGDLARRSRDMASVALGWSEQISTSLSIGWSRSPSSLAGRWWNAADDPAAGHGRLHVRGHRAPGRDERLELVADPDEGVGHRDRRPCRRALGASCVRGRRPRRPTAWRSRRGRRRRRPRCRPRRCVSSRSGHCADELVATSIARYFDREPSTTSKPTDASRAPSARARRAGATEDADAHRRSLAHEPSRPTDAGR